MVAHCVVCRNQIGEGYDICQCGKLYCSEDLPPNICYYCEKRLCNVCNDSKCSSCNNLVCKYCPKLKCDLCNGSFCMDCLESCRNGKFACKTCLVYEYTCCGGKEIAPLKYNPCTVCEKSCCELCGSFCKSCNKFTCNWCVNHDCNCHLSSNSLYGPCNICHDYFCAKCVNYCGICGNSICRNCIRERCRKCCRIICADHMQALDQIYCSDCVVSCDGCQGLYDINQLKFCNTARCVKKFCPVCIVDRCPIYCYYCKYLFCPKHSIIERINMNYVCHTCWVHERILL